MFSVVVDDHPLNSLRHKLRLHGLCEEIQLEPFSETEVADYLAKRSSSLANDEAFVRSLHERTDGVPHFVASVIGDVLARAAQSDGDKAIGTQLASAAVPEHLAAIIDHYIAKLSKIVGHDAAQVGEARNAIAREQLWLVAPRAGQESDVAEQLYAFRQALFRQVLYERAAPSARTQLRRKVGAVLGQERAEGVPVTAAELAMHFERGRDPMTALRFYAEAAEAALLHPSPEECVSLCGHGLSLLEHAPRPERNAVEIRLATLRGVSAVPDTLCGRLENLVTGTQREFASGRELRDSNANDLEEIEREFARMHLLRRVRIPQPGVIRRVLQHDAMVCGTHHPEGFRKLHELVMLHLKNRDNSADASGQAQTTRVEDYAVERLKSSLPELAEEWPA